MAGPSPSPYQPSPKPSPLVVSTPMRECRLWSIRPCFGLKSRSSISTFCPDHAIQRHIAVSFPPSGGRARALSEQRVKATFDAAGENDHGTVRLGRDAARYAAEQHGPSGAVAARAAYEQVDVLGGADQELRRVADADVRLDRHAGLAHDLHHAPLRVGPQRAADVLVGHR